MNIFKTLVITAMIATVQTIAPAQETPAGKNAAATFWKAIEGNRAVQAKNSLESLKRREPNFDTSKMEKALAELTNKREAVRTAGMNETRAKIKGGQILEDLFDGMPRSRSFADPGDVDAEIAENSAMRDEVLAMDRALIEPDLDRALEGLKSSLTYNQSKNAELLKAINDSTNPEHSRRAYNELVYNQAFWDNAAKVFPEEADFAAIRKTISDTIKGLGTQEQMATRAEKNRNAAIDAVRMPKAAVSDAKLENWFKTSFMSSAANHGKSYTFLKVVITGADYYIERNELTGIITGRTRGAAIAFKDADGTCKWGRYSMSQQYAGGGTYSAGRFSSNLDEREIRCENVK